MSDYHQPPQLIQLSHHPWYLLLPPTTLKEFFSSIFGLGDHFQVGSGSEGWLKLKSSLEKPSYKCRGKQAELRVPHSKSKLSEPDQNAI